MLGIVYQNVITADHLKDNRIAVSVGRWVVVLVVDSGAELVVWAADSAVG